MLNPNARNSLPIQLPLHRVASSTPRALSLSLVAYAALALALAGCEERKSETAPLGTGATSAAALKATTGTSNEGIVPSTTVDVASQVNRPASNNAARIAALMAATGSQAPVATAAPAVPPPPDVAAAPADAAKTKSGLASRKLQPGKGTAHPVLTDSVKVNYTGWTPDGKMFDSSITKGEPIVFGVGGVIKGWTEGLQLMVAGEKRRLWVPSALAYGDAPTRNGAPSGPLVFDVELLEILVPPATPSDVAAAPASAKKTESGIAYRVLKPGTEKVHPTVNSEVSVHYSGWTPDGKLFDTSITRGAPTKFPLGNVIPGWTEGVQLMVVGEKTRFWIPGKLAYGEGASGGMPPRGPLVFDVELLEIK